MPGVMSWVEMDWLYPDFQETGLLYHGTDTENLFSIFQKGLIPRFKTYPDEKHETIYEALYRHRPDNIPIWVDPRRCIFGYMNRKRYGVDRIVNGTVHRLVIGIKGEEKIIQNTWTGIFRFSDWVYCPKEAGYFDTEDRAEYYRNVVEPICAGAYWKMSLSFKDNLKIRHDHLLHTQGYFELLICSEAIEPGLLSLQAITVKGSNGVGAVLRNECLDTFQAMEDKIKQEQDLSDEFRTISKYASSRSPSTF